MDFDRLFIKDLLVRCIIGIKPEEREKKQDVMIQITLFCDLTKSCESDDIADTVDYARIKSKIVTMVEDSSFYLVEKLAQKITDICLEEKKVEKVKVRLEKPGALRFAKSVGVEINRRRR